MNFAGIEAFLAVVSTKSISKAADMLFSSQSTVSMQLKALEGELGVTLIERGKGHRQVELTPKGEEFIPIAERFMQLSREAGELRYSSRSTLTVCSGNSLNVYAFAPLYKELVDSRSDLHLRILTAQTPQIYEHMESHTADIGYVHYPMRHKNTWTKPVFEEEMQAVWLVAPEAAGIGPAIHPKDLDFSKEILFQWGLEFNQWHDIWRRQGVLPRVEVDTVALFLRFLQGEFWAIVPVSIIRVLRDTHSLLACPLAYAPPKRTSYQVTHRHPKPSAVKLIREFEEGLSSYLVDSGFTLHPDFLK